MIAGYCASGTECSDHNPKVCNKVVSNYCRFFPHIVIKRELQKNWRLGILDIYPKKSKLEKQFFLP